MMTKMPVAGVVWQTLHYLLGFRRLGFDVHYVETHGRTPSMLMRSEGEDWAARAAAFIAAIMRRFGLEQRWAYNPLYQDHRCFGMSEEQLAELYASAELIFNLHGGTEPLPAMAATDRLVYVETDPAQLQFELAGGLQSSFDFLDAHCAFFTYAENYGNSDCLLPVTDRYRFHPTRQPVLVNTWGPKGPPASDRFTTIGNWRQLWRDITVEGETYTWSKHSEFERLLGLPSVVGDRFELALGSYADEDRKRLEEAGWRVVSATSFSMDLHAYRDYIARSYGEFTVAKDQNVRLRTGWFSDRSATYLAAGRPVITQDTGFGAALPLGTGLFAFASAEEVAAAVESIDSRPEEHRRAAAEIGREYFGHDVVLGEMLDHLGVDAPMPGRSRRSAPPGGFPRALPLEPASRRPLELRAEAELTIRNVPLPPLRRAPARSDPEASIVVVSYGTLTVTRLCLETVLAHTEPPSLELIVVDNGSTDGSLEYLLELAGRDSRVRLVANSKNVGFPAACNQGLALAHGGLLVLLNNDTMVPPGWLARLAAHLDDPGTGLVGPVTNRIGNEAEVETAYETWGGFLDEALARGSSRSGAFEIPTLTMFCLALRREVFERLGPLDTRFGAGTLEDDDYSARARDAGYRLLCAEDVLVHHFGEGSFGRLFGTGEYSRLIEKNRVLYEQKWGRPWRQYKRRQPAAYEELVAHLREVLATSLPAGSTVLVVSKGDERLLELDGVEAWHFPRTEGGTWAGHHPADSAEALAQLERWQAEGAAYLALPRTEFWWLDFYSDFAERLAADGDPALRDDECIVFALDPARRPEPSRNPQ